MHETSVALGVLAALFEDLIPYPGPKSVCGNWPLDNIYIYIYI